jgi:multiple sugar transport system permease protein
VSSPRTAGQTGRSRRERLSTAADGSRRSVRPASADTTQPGSPAPTPRRRSTRQGRQEARAGYLFLLPNFLGFLAFSLLPIAACLALTFTKWNLILPPKFSGGKNYSQLVSDALFWKTLGNTAYYTVGAVPVAVFLAFWLALLLNRGFRGTKFFRTIYFLPYVTLTVAIAIVWSWIYNPDLGILNYALGLVGIDGPAWLQDPGWAMPAVIIMSDWQGIGYPLLIFLAALQGVPEEFYESAMLDGASWLQRVRHITVPTIAPATFYIVVISFIGAMQGFDQFYVMTQGGPAYATTTIVMYIYQQGFQWFNMGYAATLAVVLFAIIAVITAVMWRVNARNSNSLAAS